MHLVSFGQELSSEIKAPGRKKREKKPAGVEKGLMGGKSSVIMNSCFRRRCVDVVCSIKWETIKSETLRS